MKKYMKDIYIYIYREKRRGGKIDIERKKGANRNIRRR